jgi:hypothetical protein
MNTHTDRDPSRVVRVATAPNEALAGFWRSVLEDEGIVVAVKAGGAGFALGTNALNEHHILVRDDQAEQARAILAELEADADADSEDWDYDPDGEPEPATLDAKRDS